MDKAEEARVLLSGAINTVPVPHNITDIEDEIILSTEYHQ